MQDNQHEQVEHSALLHLYRLIGQLGRVGHRTDVGALDDTGFQWVAVRGEVVSTLLINGDGTVDLVVSGPGPHDDYDYHWEPLDFDAKSIVARWLEAVGDLTLN